MLPLISVIVPVYNVSAYLPRCINSLIAQSYNNLEIILIDDGSTDGSAIICDQYAKEDERVRVFHISNSGPSVARNEGIKNASGEWISFVDGDDWVSSSFISLLFHQAVNNNADISYCDWVFIFNDSTKPYLTFDPSDNKQESISKLLLEGYHVVWNKLYKRSLLESNHLLFPEEIRMCEDTWFSVLAFYYSNIVSKVSQALYYYDKTVSSALTKSHQSEKAQLDKYKVYQGLLDFFSFKGQRDLYEKPIYWRVLQEKTWIVLHPEYHKLFNSIMPESKHYIVDNPLLGWKMKILSWLVAHNLGIIIRPFVTKKSSVIER